MSNVITYSPTFTVQAGLQGPPGIPGPSAVSADAGNLATLGSDDLILVATSQVATHLTRHDPPWMDVTAAGAPGVAGLYAYATESNGKPSYTTQTGGMAWADGQWAISLGDDTAYTSGEDVPTPADVVAWTAGEVDTGNLYVTSGLDIDGLNGEYRLLENLFSNAAGDYYIIGHSEQGFSTLRNVDSGRFFALGTGANPLTAVDWENLCLTLVVGELTAQLVATQITAIDSPIAFAGYDGTDQWQIEPEYLNEDFVGWVTKCNYVARYTSADIVNRPHLCATWVAVTGTPPLPVITVADTIAITRGRIAPAPLPTVVAREIWANQTPLAADGAGGVIPFTAPVSYPFTFTALTDWMTATDAAQALVAALGLPLGPSHGEEPGQQVMIHFAAGSRWGMVRCWIDFGTLLGEWALECTVVAGDLVTVHGVTLPF